MWKILGNSEEILGYFGKSWEILPLFTHFQVEKIEQDQKIEGMKGNSKRVIEEEHEDN